MQRLSSSAVGWLGTPGRGKDLVSRPAMGRVCSQAECATVLSTYNSESACWIHRDRSPQRNTFRP
jgi:hypothetical protein